MIYDFIIIGSGISGSLIAAYLNKQGKKILVLEKENQIGGRFSSVAIGNGFANDGNLFIRDSHHLLVEFIDQLLANFLEEIRIDYVNFIDEQFHVDSRFIYLPKSKKMIDLPTKLLENIEYQTSSELLDVSENEGILELTCPRLKFKTKHIIITAFNSKIAEIMEKNKLKYFKPYVSKMLSFVGHLKSANLDYPYYKFINHLVLKELFFDRSTNLITIHTNDFINENKKLSQEDIYKYILSLLQNYFKAEIEFVHFKTWTFNHNHDKVKIPICQNLGSAKIFFIGDWLDFKNNLTGVEESLQNMIKEL
jgi:predicted NAD/FAD-dependent oxidoreductase